MKTILFVITFLCFTISTFAQQAEVRIKGLKGVRVATAPLNKNVGRNTEIAPIDTNLTVNSLTIKQVVPNTVYIIGLKSSVTFYLPSVENPVNMEMTDNGFKPSTGSDLINIFLNELSNDFLYSIPNLLVNTYITYVISDDWISVDTTVICREDYASKVSKIRKKSISKFKQLKLNNAILEKNVLALIDELYWETIERSYRILTYDGLKVPESTLDAISRFNFDDSNFLQYKKKQDIISTYIEVQELRSKVEITPTNYIAVKSSLLKHVDFRDNYIIDKLNGVVNRGVLINIMEIVDSCNGLVSEKSEAEYLKVKNKAQSLVDANTKDGIEAHPFTLENEKGEMVSLSDFKGKYVYIDIWATWCGPCNYEIPKLKVLEKEMEGYDIAFISISVDKPKDKQAWLTFIKEHELPGTTLITDNAFDFPFGAYYNLKGIPRFMLIDPNGKMISNNCWRPSDPKLKEYLMSLCKPINQ